MKIVYIAWASSGAILQIIVIGIAYLVGRNDGYWKRIDEESSARGIR